MSGDMQGQPFDIIALPVQRAGEVVEVLSEAFFVYPVMEYVLGPRPDYAVDLRALVEFFVMARFVRDDLVLGAVGGGDTLAGVATITLPGEKESPGELTRLRESLWDRLGDDARGRYERFGEACRVFDIEHRHYHLNMIGVRRAHTGQGVGRVLLEAVHRVSAEDAESRGVTLTTEDPANLPLYQRFGYRILGHVEVGTDLESWGLFREEA
jgi:GNAT superfamily N-acetyltransferase